MSAIGQSESCVNGTVTNETKRNWRNRLGLQHKTDFKISLLQQIEIGATLTSTGHAVSCEARVARAAERSLGIAARGVRSTVVGCRVGTLVDVCSVDNTFGLLHGASNRIRSKKDPAH